MPQPVGTPVLAGYDVVSYFDPGKAAKGSRETSLLFRSYPPPSATGPTSGDPWHEFWFSSRENKEKFREDPSAYLPRFGGFCAWGLATEFTDEDYARLPPDFPTVASGEAQGGWNWSRDDLGPPAGPEDGWVVWRGKLYLNIHKGIKDRLVSGGDRAVEDRIRAAEIRWEEWWGVSGYLGAYNNMCYEWNWKECHEAGHGWRDAGVTGKLRK